MKTALATAIAVALLLIVIIVLSATLYAVIRAKSVKPEPTRMILDNGEYLTVSDRRRGYVMLPLRPLEID